MMIREIDIIVVSSECGDWEGIYIDGELEFENHSIYSGIWMSIIRKFKHFSGKIESYEVKDEWLEDRGNFPELFKDIPKEMLV